eukprot:s6519_g1.t1
MGPRRASTTSRSSKTSVKQDKLKDHQARSQKMSEAMTLENLVDRLKERPTIVSHIFNLLEMGAYDQIDQPEKVDQDSLPKSCNKFASLSRDYVMQLIDDLCPTFKEGLHAINAQSKISKKELLQTLCYMCHVASDSALPSKSWASLKKFVYGTQPSRGA